MASSYLSIFHLESGCGAREPVPRGKHKNGGNREIGEKVQEKDPRRYEILFPRDVKSETEEKVKS